MREVHKHFKDCIKKDPKNNRCVICCPCKQKNYANHNGLYEYLGTHLESEGHRCSVDEARKEEIPGTIAALKQFRARKKKVIKVTKDVMNSMRADVTLFLVNLLALLNWFLRLIGILKLLIGKIP